MKPILLSAFVLSLFSLGNTSVIDAADVALDASSTKIEFVCAHVGEKPDPREGSFGKLTGKADVDAGTLKSVEVEIDTNSIKTSFEKLTAHLKSPEFFDVRQHPKATFKSTKIVAGETAGTVKVTGNLTLLGVTKEVSFPATVSSDGGLKFHSKFDIDRSQFGMTYGEGKVEYKVSMTVAIDTTK